MNNHKRKNQPLAEHPHVTIFPHKCGEWMYRFTPEPTLGGQCLARITWRKHRVNVWRGEGLTDDEWAEALIELQSQGEGYRDV